MCTSITLMTENGASLLARTMDFAVILETKPTLIPREINAFKEDSNRPKHSTYAYIGMARKTDHDFHVFADGVNEKGLACASLYFSDYAGYNSHEKNKSITVAPHDVVALLLSSCETVSQAMDLISDTRITDTILDFIGISLPLHWVVSDKLGHSIVIEFVDGILHLHQNDIGIMTNSPDYLWHTTNLRNYTGLHNVQKEQTNLHHMTLKPFGEGAGSFGLPGDFTPPSRFVRATFLKYTLDLPKKETDGINGLLHILASVDIPKGVVKTAHYFDYTQYTSIMSSASLTYSFKTYDNHRIRVIDLNKENLTSPTIKVWGEGDQEDSLLLSRD